MKKTYTNTKKLERKQVFDKFGGKCAYCGRNLDIGKFQVDHVIPKSNFDSCLKNNFDIPEFLKHLCIEDCEHIDNKMPACASCNLYKSSQSLRVFRMSVGDLVKQCRRTTQFRIAERFGLVQENNIDVKFYFENYENN